MDHCTMHNLVRSDFGMLLGSLVPVLILEMLQCWSSIYLLRL